MPANASFDKGAVVEEWADAHFFRPVGLRIARLAFPTRVTPDQITLIALLTGLAAGHLLFYHSVALNAAGVAMFLVSDFFDSADGQLARMRQTSTRFGRMLDGLSDTLRFANLYATLIARLLVASEPAWFAITLGAAGGLLHSMQSSWVDYIKQLYMYIARGGDGELDLPEDVARIAATATGWHRLQVRIYAGYVARQARTFASSVAVVRRLRATDERELLAAEWAAREQGIVQQCAWVAQNIRFLLLALLVVPGYVNTYLWVTIGPMTVIALALVTLHERRAAAMLHDDEAPRLVTAES
ncbi:MAG TPA: CDP-alcohol phosphatidyltransferase family protein [Gemmatimonadales bacterium]|jgi:phosphatidylglycerophosphate synthase